MCVYVPSGYPESSARYPAVYVIQGYTGHLSMWANRTPFRQPFIETADAVSPNGAPGCVDAGHGGIDYSCPLSLGLLAERLAR